MSAGDDYWYKDAIIYEVHVRAFHDSVGDGHRRLPRPDAEARLSAGPGHHGDLALALLSVAAQGRRLRHRRLHEHPSALRHARRTSRSFSTPPIAADMRVITELVLNHTSDQHPWFQRARLAAAGQPASATSTSGATRPRSTRTRGSSSRTSSRRTGPGTRSPRRTTGTGSTPTSPTSTSTTRPSGRRIFPVVDFWLEMGVDGMRLDAVPYLYEREGTNCENLPETHAFLKALRRTSTPGIPNRMFLAEANQWPEDAVAYFGDGRRMPHGVPLPADAAPVHGAAPGRPLPDHRHPGPDAGHPGQLPVVPVPAQPRRADAGDGDRRGARLHVPGLRPRPARADQPGHPPPARAAAEQRSPPDRADERPAVLAARHAGDLLRRRDRHGRQHLPGRSQRRAHAHAVVGRPQRRLLAGPTRRSSTCRSSSTRNTTTRR